MNLRSLVKEIVRETVGADLRKLVRETVREVLMEELTREEVPDIEPESTLATPATSAKKAPDPKRSASAKKAAKKRAANKQLRGSAPLQAKTPVVPRVARQMGLALGQQFKGKSYLDVKDRIIEIASMDVTGITPRILKSEKGRTQAKHMTFTHLKKCYDRVE
jgi:pyruvate/2-oxoglutarate dehydrogenase complex dihydrolipoamide acyltransferase (E2) component